MLYEDFYLYGHIVLTSPIYGNYVLFKREIFWEYNCRKLASYYKDDVRINYSWDKQVELYIYFIQISLNFICKQKIQKKKKKKKTHWNH